MPSVRALLIRGMLAGLAAGLLAVCFAAVFGEPEVDNAIAVEGASAGAHSHHAATAGDEHVEESPPVSRHVQKTFGLATGISVYGIALGGVFALVFSFAQGRIVRARPRITAAVLAAAMYVSVVLVPFIKYPATPPAVGDPDTIERRTMLFVAMITISVAAAIVSTTVGRSLVVRFGGWYAAVAGGLLFAVVVAIAMVFLPTVNELQGFPADVLWRFRLASLGTHLVLWTGISIIFGALVEHALEPKPTVATTSSFQRA